MSKSYSLPTEPEGIIPSLIERFNSGKVSAMETLYEGAVLIADDGRIVTDRAEIAAELERDLSLAAKLRQRERIRRRRFLRRRWRRGRRRVLVNLQT